ncbi:MAG TPA: hypothetical protein VMT55_04625, partial [Candidatus Sulfotelmatobacter sp.]|nr:hypothetical protein [Candidatus Sulfotelmatobacter sp.]
IELLIDSIYKADRNSLTSKLDSEERAALKEAGNGLISDIGGGKIGVNSAAFSQLRDRLEWTFNSFTLLAKINEGQGNLLRAIARALGIAVGREETSVSEAFSLAKERSQQNLETLKGRVHDYAERHNQIVDYRRDMFVAIAATAVTVANFGLNVLPKMAKVKGWSEGLSGKIRNYLNEKLGKSSAALFDPKTTFGRTMISLVKGLDQGYFDGKIGWGDLAGMLLNVLLSKQLATFLAEEAHQATVSAPKGRALAAERSTASSGAAIDTLDRMTEREDQTLGRIEIDQQIFENEKKMKELLDMFLGASFVNAIHGIGYVRPAGEAKMIVPTEADPTAAKAPDAQGVVLPAVGALSTPSPKAAAPAQAASAQLNAPRTPQDVDKAKESIKPNNNNNKSVADESEETENAVSQADNPSAAVVAPPANPESGESTPQGKTIKTIKFGKNKKNDQAATSAAA